MGALWATGRPIEALGGGSAIRAFENAPGGELPGLPFPGRSPVHGRGQWPCHSRKRKRSGDEGAGVGRGHTEAQAEACRPPEGRRAFKEGGQMAKHRRPIRQRPWAPGRRSATCDCGWKPDERPGRRSTRCGVTTDKPVSDDATCAAWPGARRKGEIYRSVRLRDGQGPPRGPATTRSSTARYASCPRAWRTGNRWPRPRAEDHRQQGDELYGECVPPDPPRPYMLGFGERSLSYTLPLPFP